MRKKHLFFFWGFTFLLLFYTLLFLLLIINECMLFLREKNVWRTTKLKFCEIHSWVCGMKVSQLKKTLSTDKNTFKTRVNKHARQAILLCFSFLSCCFNAFGCACYWCLETHTLGSRFFLFLICFSVAQTDRRSGWELSQRKTSSSHTWGCIPGHRVIWVLSPIPA